MKSKNSLSKEILRAVKIEAARRSFWFFCCYYDPDFFKKRPFLERIADAFQKIHDREIHSLSVSLPPRSGKSYVTTLFAAWTLGKNPKESVMRNTCTATLYNKFSYDTRNVLRNEKFADVFPGVDLASDKQNLIGWNLKESKQVGYFGAGVGGTIIGFGASAVAITDDLYKSLEDALSAKTNESVKQWKQSAHDSRMEKNCPTVDIGTRWSKNDIIGENQENKKYDISISVAALDADENSFCEEVKSTEEYRKIRDDLLAANSEEIWLAEYQQEPAEVQGLLFRRSDIKRFTMEEFIQQTQNEKEESLIETILGYIDPAEGGGDPLAFIIGCIMPSKVFVTDVIYTKEDVSLSVPRCAELIKRRNVNYTRVEKNGLGSGFIRDMKRSVNETKILHVSNATHKGTRIWNEYGFIQKHFYFLKESKEKPEYIPGSDYDKFMRNLFSYMKIGDNQEDGAPDATAGLSRFIQLNPQTKKLFPNL